MSIARRDVVKLESVVWMSLTAVTACAACTSDGDKPSDAGAADTGTKPDGAPYAACPDVYTGPAPGHDDVGAVGLAVLRARVTRSRDDDFRKYAQTHGNTYRYTRWFTSFTGSACSDTIRVTNGVVESITEATRPDRTTGLGWSSPTTYGPDAAVPFCAPALTMDRLYDQCLNETLCQDPRENRLYVHVDARGLLVQCGYVPLDCADDCYRGFGPILLTTDGSDWTKSLPGCCTPSPAPDCCMIYGGPESASRCGEICDGMPGPTNPGWQISFDDQGCAEWMEPQKRNDSDCCGCK